MENLEKLDCRVHEDPQADQGKLAQAWWVSQGYLVFQDFQGKLVVQEESSVPQENQGSQDHLACLEHQDQRGPLAQMCYIVVLGVLDQ